MEERVNNLPVIFWLPLTLLVMFFLLKKFKYTAHNPQETLSLIFMFLLLADMRQNEFRHIRNPPHSACPDMQRPWVNLSELQHHRCDKIPIARQLHADQRTRLQLKNFADKNKYRNSERIIRRVPCTIDHSQPRTRPEMSSFREQSVFPLPPPSDHDRSFMTYDDDDDDMSTTTSGSYTIDHEDLTIDLRASGIEIPGLRSCLV